MVTKDLVPERQICCVDDTFSCDTLNFVIGTTEGSGEHRDQTTNAVSTPRARLARILQNQLRTPLELFIFL